MEKKKKKTEQQTLIMGPKDCPESARLFPVVLYKVYISVKFII